MSDHTLMLLIVVGFCAYSAYITHLYYRTRKLRERVEYLETVVLGIWNDETQIVKAYMRTNARNSDER